jgi:hypothetical protein
MVGDHTEEGCTWGAVLFHPIRDDRIGFKPPQSVIELHVIGVQYELQWGRAELSTLVGQAPFVVCCEHTEPFVHGWFAEDLIILR